MLMNSASLRTHWQPPRTVPLRCAMYSSTLPLLNGHISSPFNTLGEPVTQKLSGIRSSYHLAARTTTRPSGRSGPCTRKPMRTRRGPARRITSSPRFRATSVRRAAGVSTTDVPTTNDGLSGPPPLAVPLSRVDARGAPGNSPDFPMLNDAPAF